MKTIPAGRSLIVLVGPSGSGKSHLARKHFPSREIVSMDGIREEFLGDIRRQDKNDLVRDEFLSRIEAKLRAGQRVIADATHIKNKDRRETAEIGEMMNAQVIYLVVDRPMKTKHSHGGWRLEERINNRPLLESHQETFNANEETILLGDHSKGRVVIDTRSDEWRVTNPLPREHDLVLPYLLTIGYPGVRVIGDVHGSMEGLKQSLQTDLFPIFLGDVVDYGSDTLETAKKVGNLVRMGKAAMVRGNHERKIARWVLGNRNLNWQGSLTHGNEVTTNQLQAMDVGHRTWWEDQFLALVDMSPDWIQLGDNIILAHAAVHRRMWGYTIHRVPLDSPLEVMAMYGETTGILNEYGRPERTYKWVDALPQGSVAVVGHAVRSMDAPFEHKGNKGGKAVFLDTGSSKAVDEYDGRVGQMSWMDFDIHEYRKSEPKLIFQGYGSEV